MQWDGIGRGHLLELGPSGRRQHFFHRAGFQGSIPEDLLATWKLCRVRRKEQWRELSPGAAALEMTPAPGRAFLERHTDSSGEHIRCRVGVDLLEISMGLRVGWWSRIRHGSRWRSASPIFQSRKRKNFIVIGSLDAPKKPGS